MDPLTLFYRFGLALVIGGLVGLQREHAEREEEHFAGVRTFVLFSLAGAGGALAAELLGHPGAFLVLLGAVGVLIAVSHGVAAWRGAVGVTTEVAALLTFLTGALCYWGKLELAAALGVVMTVLLSLKLELRRFARALSREEVLAALKLAVITAVVLPLLPDRSFGPPPWDAFNPHRVWLMVVLVSALGFAGYVLMRRLGPGKGIGLTGVLGGLVSSTAVTLAFAGRGKREPSLAPALAVGIVGAWTVMFARILVVVAVVNPSLLGPTAVPILTAGLVGLAASLFLLRRARRGEAPEVELAAPFELGPAVRFGLLYAAILVAARAASLSLGDLGAYLASAVAAVADVDAITLTMAELGRSGGVDPRTASQAVVLAALTNTLVKGGLVVALGGQRLRTAIVPVLLLILAAGIGLVFLR
ncbi:MAG: MgtC/SapB family protein [Candidatus Bipolaricaulota bacterium]|nr:MgtC/SapB family protein [Candidatus Bipolaricaulota bacterium]